MYLLFESQILSNRGRVRGRGRSLRFWTPQVSRTTRTRFPSLYA